jgi:hypothetical protein
MIPVAAPPRVRDLLRAAPDGPVPVVHAGDLAVYVEVAGRCVGVLAAGAARVPCGLRTTLNHLLPILSTNGVLTAYLGGGTLHVGSRSLPIGRTEGSYVPRLRPEVVRSTEASPDTVEATPPATVAGLAAVLLPHGRLDADAVPLLVGRGEGLTPLGDDLLAGWLVTRIAAGAPDPAVADAVRRLRGRTTALSATLLDCALRGEALPELRAWLTALGTPAEPVATQALEAVGATSGTGLLTGAALALRSLETHHIDHPGRVA